MSRGVRQASALVFLDLAFGDDRIDRTARWNRRKANRKERRMK